MEPGPVKSCPGILLPPGSRSHQAKVGVSGSFKTSVTTLDELSQAIPLYISRGAEKLRYQESFAEALTVYVMTNRFKSKSYYYNSKTVVFPTASNNTPELIRKGQCLLKQIFQSGKYYTKAGILFSSLTRVGQVPLDLFDATDRYRSQRLMSALDKINTRMGSYSVRCAAMGLSGQQQWKGACDDRSQAYTTDWE
ncbi:DinB/UmuC family translesion DNA polymerase [Desulfocicer niacini]